MLFTFCGGSEYQLTAAYYTTIRYSYSRYGKFGSWRPIIHHSQPTVPLIRILTNSCTKTFGIKY